MNDFEFYSPTRFVFGRGVTDAVGQHVAELGYKRALLVYGGGSVVRTGTLARVKKSLVKAGVEFVELSGRLRESYCVRRVPRWRCVGFLRQEGSH